jgi:hypothetical protein
MFRVGVEVSGVILQSDGDVADECFDISKTMLLVALPRPGDGFTLNSGKYDDLQAVVKFVEFWEERSLPDGSVGVAIILESDSKWHRETALEQGWLLEPLVSVWDELFKST